MLAAGGRPLPPRGRWISLGLGVLFAGNVFFLFTAIATIEVPVAILTYFVYPLLTGLAAAATGLESSPGAASPRRWSRSSGSR